MVAKISFGSSLYGALAYNGEKINKEEGKLLATNKIFDDCSGKTSIANALRDFQRYLSPHIRTEKPVVHISLNPHPDDVLTDMDMENIAREYLERMGYGNQPYMVYKHEDIDRHHMHIVTIRVDENGKCLDSRYNYHKSKVIQNTVGNVFSGQVVGETAKTLSERFGKVLQQRQSMTINRNDKSTSISTQMDSLIPASKISNLTQGIFVGAVSDNFDERIDQKIFHAEIVVDSVKVSAEMKAYQPIPVIVEFKNEDGSDNLKETIEANYRKVKQEILTLVDSEIQRIKNTPALSHLIPDK